MAITYSEKGAWLHDALHDAGYWVASNFGVVTWGKVDGSTTDAADEAAVQAIIDSFDPLPYAKADKVDKIKEQAAKQASSIYSFLETDPKQAIDFYNFAEDMYLCIHVSMRNALPQRLQDFKNVKDAATDAITAVNAMTDWTAVMAYDEVNTPAWP